MPSARSRLEWLSGVRKTLSTKSNPGASLQKIGRRQLLQLGFIDHQRQAAIAPGDRMADPVTFMGIEKKHLVRFRYSLILSHMAHVYAAIREYELGCSRTLFGAH